MAILKSLEEIKIMKESCRITALVLQKLKESIRPGMTTSELDMLAREECVKYRARPAFLGYRGYTAAVCVSINNEVIHGIPSPKRVIKNGDIVSLDFGVEKDGFYGDSALTVPVGDVEAKYQRLIDITRNALEKGIAKACAGNRLHDISAAIQGYVEKNGFSVVRDFTGHAIGRALHEDPMVPNFGKPGTGETLQVGMTLAIEPMVNEKRFEVKVLKDKWTTVTVDGGMSAHYEHTIAITENGPIILTLPE